MVSVFGLLIRLCFYVVVGVGVFFVIKKINSGKAKNNSQSNEKQYNQPINDVRPMYRDSASDLRKSSNQADKDSVK